MRWWRMKKIEEYAKKDVKANIRVWFREYVASLHCIMKELEKAESTSEFMELKKKLMRCMIKSLPLESKYCPFCEFYLEFNQDTSCDNCEYKKAHGKCNSKSSTWRKIRDLQEELLDAIRDYWYGYELGEEK